MSDVGPLGEVVAIRQGAEDHTPVTPNCERE